MRILALDDEPFALKLLAHQLKTLGHDHVHTCTSGAEATAYLRAEKEALDLIVSDLQMPEMDGVEFVRQLAMLGYAGELILVSGEDKRILQTAERVARAHAINILGVLHKPASPEQIQALLSKHRPDPVSSERKRATYAATELEQAIDKGQLRNVYQPKVSLKTGELVGVETLVRWLHPRDGLVMPDQFIPVAEDAGLITRLTRRVLVDALTQASEWQAAGLSFSVAVNVSMDDLTELGFPELVTETATRLGVPLTSLVLEVTESRLMSNRLAALDILTRLRLKRVSLSIDDFGTGHSSLAQLRDVPFDELKVDRSFVHGAHADASLCAILDASLSLAHRLGMRSVAEGVEDIADWHMLRACGCNYAQGYFIGRPMPAEELDTWHVAWQTRLAELLEA
ncbi:MAG: EAL domain-containing response regulator [Rhodocyclaceae bacterium]|nr:EAL domain-containing response regulator [Rhodocyclaceae bacterium]